LHLGGRLRFQQIAQNLAVTFMLIQAATEQRHRQLANLGRELGITRYLSRGRENGLQCLNGIFHWVAALSLNLGQ